MYWSCEIKSESHFYLGRHELQCWYKKRHCLNKDKKCDKTVKQEYERRSSGLEGKPNEMVWPEDGSLRNAVATPAIIEKNDNIVSERVLSFVIEFADIMQLVAKHQDRRSASQLIELLNVTFIALNSFRRYIKSVADHKDASAKNIRKILKNDGSCRVLTRGCIEEKDGCGTSFLKALTGLHRKQVEFCGKDDTTFCPCHGKDLSRVAITAMSTNYIQTCYEEVEIKMTRFCGSGGV